MHCKHISFPVRCYVPKMYILWYGKPWPVQKLFTSLLGLGVGISASGLGGTFLSRVEYLFFSGLLPPPAFPLCNSLGSDSAVDSSISKGLQSL